MAQSGLHARRYSFCDRIIPLDIGGTVWYRLSMSKKKRQKAIFYSVQMPLRMTPTLKGMIEEAAEFSGERPTDWARDALAIRAKYVLDEKKAGLE